VSEPYGPRHPEVRALRELARDPRARADAGACLLEGPRVISAALERDAEITVAYLGHGAGRAFPDVTTRLARAGVPVHDLKEGVLERIGTTRTPQPLLAVARWAPHPLGAVADAAATGFVLVALDIADPGNLGTILRSAEAAGAVGVVVAGTGVDLRSPKVVRASAGAVFGVPVVEAPDAAAALAGLRAAGVRCLAAVARGGHDPGASDLARGVAIVVGNEAHGIPPDLADHLDGTITIPMAGVAESLNVGMAATVLCFEAARQRAALTGDGGQ
jgi:TrmH family RNA methyltransferase